MASPTNTRLMRIFRLLLVGERDVGKTSLVRRYVDSPFEFREIIFPDVSVSKKTIQVDDEVVSVHLWDTTDCDTIENVDLNYVRWTDAVLLVFDCTQRRTFDKMRHWYEFLKNSVNPQPLIFIVATKFEDYRKQEVFFDDLRKLSYELDVMVHRTSSLNGYGIEDYFRTILEDIKIRKDQEIVERAHISHRGIWPILNRFLEFLGSVFCSSQSIRNNTNSILNQYYLDFYSRFPSYETVHSSRGSDYECQVVGIKPFPKHSDDYLK